MGDRLTPPSTPYVEVALQARTARLGRLLTYAVPRAWAVRPGQVVWVPLRRRAAVGVVARVAAPAPGVPTRPILAVLGSRPLLGARQMALAAWLAERYACSLADALSGFMPTGARAAPRVSPGPEGAETLAAEPAARPLAEALRRRRSLPLAEAAELAGVAVVADLLRAGTLRAILPDALPAWADPPPVALPPPRSALTLAQRDAFETLRAALDAREHASFLLHGVTGSGKTHVYLHTARHALEQGRQVLALVSDISLVPAAERRFAEWFPSLVAVVHSERRPAEQRESWARIASGEARVVIGARSALFTPLGDVGLVIVDEEHEAAYKQQDVAPTYHARELALKLGELAGAVVVLGSATPDVETYWRARQGRHRLVTLPRRYVPAAAAAAGTETAAGSVRPTAGDAEAAPTPLPERDRAAAPAAPPRADLPPVQVVDLRAELAAGNTGMFSRALLAELARVLDLGQQAILFLNRRGTATCVLCRDCGYTVCCEDCLLPMIYHGDLDRLLCHHCNRRRRAPERCPGCGGRRIRYLGAGTQRVVEEVARHFPRARLLRWDRDTAARRGAHDRLWAEFASGGADILVGTQMVAKGLDFPSVTLVGVVLADASLHLPDYRAGERAFQLLTQVAGRAGRGAASGQVIVQTYSPQHYAIQAARLHDYAAFAERELAFRRAHAYPPFRRLGRLVYSDPDESRCWRECGRVLRELRAASASQAPGVQLIGPAPAYLRRLRGRYRWQLVVAAPAPERLLAACTLPAGWTVDVDPTSLL
ncbi:MAG TPA: primosomal protein N' [Chloroflexota bacterium]|nr:primosomal protein N' [Chloroflexota bacterium]